MNYAQWRSCKPAIPGTSCCAEFLLSFWVTQQAQLYSQPAPVGIANQVDAKRWRGCRLAVSQREEPTLLSEIKLACVHRQTVRDSLLLSLSPVRGPAWSWPSWIAEHLQAGAVLVDLVKVCQPVLEELLSSLAANVDAGLGVRSAARRPVAAAKGHVHNPVILVVGSLDAEREAIPLNLPPKGRSDPYASAPCQIC